MSGTAGSSKFISPSPSASSSVSYSAVKQSDSHRSNSHPSSGAIPSPQRDSPTLSSPKPGSSDSTSNGSEAVFYRRILFSSLPTCHPIPPITADEQLDHQILLLLAYLLRETVLPWYSKLTPDRQLLTEITHIVTQTVHRILPRLDDESGNNQKFARLHTLLGTELPTVIKHHFRHVRVVRAKAGSAWAPLTGETPSASPRTSSILPSGILVTELDYEPQVCLSPALVSQLYNSLCPHPGVDSDQSALQGKISLTYLRITASALLGSILSEQDVEPDVEKFIVRDVLVMVLRGSLSKCTRPWFLVQSLNKVLDAFGWPGGHTVPPTRPDASRKQVNKPPAWHQVVITTIMRIWSTLSLIFTMVLPHLVRTYLDLFTPHHHVSGQGGAAQGSASSLRRSRLQGSFRDKDRKMHGRFPTEQNESGATLQPATTTFETTSNRRHGLPAPDYAAAWIQMIEEITEARCRGLTNTTFGLIKFGVGLAGFGQQIDRVIVDELDKKLSDTEMLARLVGQVRLALLPGGHLSSPVPDPDLETQDREWKRLRRRILMGMNPWLKVWFLGAGLHTQYASLTRWLSPICAADASGPNTHLAIMLLERLIALLCPDLVE